VTKLAYSDNRVSRYKFRVTQNVAEHYVDDNRAILVHARGRASSISNRSASHRGELLFVRSPDLVQRKHTRARGHLRTHGRVSRFNEVTFDEYEKKKEKRKKKQKKKGEKKKKNHTSSCHVFNTGSNTHR